MDAGSFTKEEAKQPIFNRQDTFEQQQEQAGQSDEDKGIFSGTVDAAKSSLATSAIGMALRAREVPLDEIVLDVFRPAITNTYKFTEEDMETIRSSGLPASSFSALSGATSSENLKALIKLTKENLEHEKKIQSAGIGGQLLGGVAGAFGDPTSYLPMLSSLKGMSLLNRSLVRAGEGAASNILSEGIRSSVTGIEADYASAAVTGAIFSSSLGLLGDGMSSVRKSGIRLEARESSRNAGVDVDSSRLEGVEVPEGSNYVPHPTEEGAVVLRDGSIISEHNPINPMTKEQFDKVDPERSARGVSLGGFTEIGYTIMRSESPDVRAIGEGLVRSPVGTESGGRGKTGATASDIKERIDSLDRVDYNEIMKAMDEVISDPAYMSRGGRRDDLEASAFRKIANVIEDQTGEAMQFLNAPERKLMEVVKNHFDAKGELLMNPTVFGNSNASPIMKSTRHQGTYIPHQYDAAVKASMKARFGGEDGLKEAIKKSWMESFETRPTVRERFKENFAEELKGAKDPEARLRELVEEYAERKAYGISHSDEFTYNSRLEDALDSLEGIENNNFLEARNLFDSDVNVMMSDGQSFSVNDLRNYDFQHILQAYDRRVNGDIAVVGSTGKTVKDLKDEIVALKQKAKGDGKLKAEVEALEDVMKILTGRARRDPDTAFDHIGRTLRDLSFFSKNGYMGAMNFTEIGGMVAKGNVSALMRGIPYFGELITKRATRMSKAELSDLHSAVFGKEVYDGLRPSFDRLRDRIKETTTLGDTSAKALAGARYAAQELSARSPLTKVMNDSTNYIIDSARMGTISDVANHVMFNSKTMFDEKTLKSASITPEQFEGIKQLIRDHVTVSKDGTLKVNDKKAFATDPRTMELWRLGDTMADEAVLRPMKVSAMDTKAYGAWMKLAMQFKSFTIKSVNGKTIRSLYNMTKNGRYADQALAMTLSVGLAGSFYAMRAQLAAQGLPEAQRKEYLDNALDPKMVAYAAVSRSSLVGSPLGVFNLLAAPMGFDPAVQVRTSILPRPPRPQEEKPLLYAPSFGDEIIDQIPAAGTLKSGYMVGKNALGLMNAKGYDEVQYRTGLYNGLKGLLPNDPFTQAALLGVFEEQGIMQRKK